MKPKKASMMIPSPPIQEIKDLHIERLLSGGTKFSYIVRPVVVKEDMDSKYESSKLISGDKK
jgi:hypothetical protein